MDGEEEGQEGQAGSCVRRRAELELAGIRCLVDRSEWRHRRVWGAEGQSGLLQFGGFSLEKLI
jgi:hypothetical protein